MERNLGLGRFLSSDGGDERVFEEASFSLLHALDGAAKHQLDGGLRAGEECVFDGFDLCNVTLVGAHPAANAGVKIVHVFDDEGAAGVFAVRACEVEGEHEGIAIGVEVGAEPSGGGERKMGAVDELGVDGADDGAVGTDDGGGGLEVEVAEDLHGKAVAAAGGDDDLGAERFGEAEGGAVARADLAGGVEQGSVEVDGDEAGRHVLLEYSMACGE